MRGRLPDGTMAVMAEDDVQVLGTSSRVRTWTSIVVTGLVGVLALVAACSAFGCRTHGDPGRQRADHVQAVPDAAAVGPVSSNATTRTSRDDSDQHLPPAPGAAVELEDSVTFDRERWVRGVMRPTERHPLSSLSEVQRRVGWADSEMDAEADDYDPTQESFDVAVPPSPMDPDGLLVWIPAGESGAMPPELAAALEKRHVRYVGLNNAGNERPVAVHMNLALDAVHAVCRRMPVRPDRIWVGGISGGGKTASRMALLYPEVFRGGLFVVGASYFPPVPTRDGRVWDVGIRVEATPEALARLRTRRFVLVTGGNDFNHESVLDMHRAYEKDRLPNVLLLDVPGMAHGMPTPDVLEEALGFLDQ